MSDDTSALHQVTTRTDGEALRGALTQAIVTLTVLAHSEPDRVGEEAALTPLVAGKTQPLSRLEPYFAQPGASEARPLGHFHLSRRPIELRPGPQGALILDRGGSPMGLEVDAEEVEDQLVLTADRLEGGVILLLAGHVGLVLHAAPPSPRRPPGFGLVGESAAVLRLRRQVEKLAARDHTVLLRGETGTGKELVARALHDSGPRRGGPFRAVNLGAVPAELAASELFGAAKGAFTGAGAGRLGYFQQADGGTLFLDEVAAAPAEVQVALLRVLETGRVQAVGASDLARVDVRVIAATDEDLDAAVDGERFRAPLLHRLSAHQVTLPPLRDRLEDLGRLFFHFLRLELASEGRLDKLAATDPEVRPWVPADLLARLARYPWPGNVRQLGNVVSQLVLHGLDLPEMQIPPELEQALGTTSRSTSGPAPGRDLAPTYRDARDLGEAEVRAALRRHAFEPSAAAAALGVARPSLYKRMQALGLPLASQLSAAEIESCARRQGEDPRRMAEHLEISEHGLKMRMKSLGLR